MKVKELLLRNYKGFGNDEVKLSFCNALGNVNPVTVIVGTNGSGKSSILQAIACLLGSAVRNKMAPDELEWPGFDYEFIHNGPRGLKMEATVTFTKDEILATREFAKLVFQRWDLEGTLPGTAGQVKLELEYLERKVSAVNNSAQYFQFRGYQYALQLNGAHGEFAKNLSRVGSIYWYDEQRTPNSILRPTESENAIGRNSISNTELRNILQQWDSFHNKSFREGFELREGQRDRFAELKKMYEAIFPGRTLLGSEPQRDPNKILEPPLFFLQDESGKAYELSNMSAGERAIFPLLIDFASWEMHNSIILIDELELHLHPPLQQALMKTLLKIGRNNQFIVTTHSDHVVAMYSEEEIIRL
jgi:predicted ATPase